MRNWRNSMFFKLFISYLVIFAIPLLILIGVFYYVNVVGYQREVAEANTAKLTQVRNQIDLELKSLREVIYHLSSQEEIYSTTDPMEREGLLIPQLVAYTEHYPFINDMMFYYRGDTRMYLSTGRYAYDTFENELKKDYAWTKAGFFRELNELSGPAAKRVEAKESGLSVQGSTIAFLFPVPYLETFPQGTVLFTINEDEFLSKFTNIMGDMKGHIFIYDQYYEPLVTYSDPGQAVSSEQLRLDLRKLKGTGVFQLESGGEPFVVSRMVSEELNWSYVIAVPSAVFYEQVYAMRAWIMAITIVLLVIGVFGALLFSSRSYRPVKSLLAYFAMTPHAPDPAEGKNEWEIIRHTFDSTLQKNEEMLIQMNAQRPFVKDQCLLTLLKGGKVDKTERDYLLKCSNVMMTGEAYFCMAITARAAEADRTFLEEELSSLLETIMFPGGWGYGVEISEERYTAVIVALQEAPEDHVQKRSDIAKNLIDTARKKAGVSLTIGIGKLYPDLDHIGSSYLEASAVLFDNQINDKKSVHLFDQMDNGEQQVHWYPTKEQALYIQSLKQGDEAIALEAVKALIEQMTVGTTSYLIVRCLCFDVVNHILKAINQLNAESFAGEIKELLKFNTLQEFQSGLEEFTVLFCKRVNELESSRRLERKNSIITYINEHFKESELSLEHIARQYGLSASYVSRFIKEETGVTFMDYVTSLRMHEAKLQLQRSDKLIQDIVLDIGYLNVPSFVRKFKTIEGVTPSQYRQIMGKP
ncbi:helix-turn-helix domain-containing protein [Paenibacillus arenilitoris]|uniref:AraC family transcriptional regulator n=1 Tax=Paenibacillus arenilitoris TaxID=2772299 RepID=A0A927H5Y1_9BACL|nr:helix-turn-helix domain-containing protein [Paenibacillus arenilitoris]MBD2869013.1 AraC family transcriptional regulator [Paenibacillus arenilitoris]